MLKEVFGIKTLQPSYGNIFRPLFKEGFTNGLNSFLIVVDNDCIECESVLEELEKIDGEADLFGIDFVKIASVEAAQNYGILNIPALVYFR